MKWIFLKDFLHSILFIYFPTTNQAVYIKGNSSRCNAEQTIDLSHANYCAANLFGHFQWGCWPQLFFFFFFLSVTFLCGLKIIQRREILYYSQFYYIYILCVDMVNMVIAVFNSFYFLLCLFLSLWMVIGWVFFLNGTSLSTSITL